MFRVGIGPRDYGSGTLFDGVPIPNTRFVREPYWVPRTLMRFVSSTNREMAEGSITFVPTARTQFYHTFNRVVRNRRPWLLNFESLLPRAWDQETIRRLFSYLRREECRALIAISENAAHHFRVRNEAQEGFEKTDGKIRVVYPGVPDHELLYTRRRDRGITSPIRLLFVGGDFFRKGGDVCVRAFEILRQKYDLSMTVVSHMSENNYIFPTPAGSAREYIERMKMAGITHLPHVSRSTVQTLMSDSDILLLPTLDDSFGYTVIEAMATGSVPIATAVRAIPELITNRKDGLLLEVDVTSEGRLDTSKTTTEDILERLVEALRFLLTNTSKVEMLSKAARSTFEQRFSQALLATHLAEIYSQMSDGASR